MSQIIVQAAETGSGKGERSKMIFRGFPDYHWYVLDPKKQFLDLKQEGMRFINPKSDLKIVLPQLPQYSIVCIDEAPIRFPLAATNPEITEALLQCRHNFCTILLNFHALQQVPIYIRNYINTIIIGKTNDEAHQAGKFGKRTQAIAEAIQIVDNDPSDHAAIVIDKEYMRQWKLRMQQVR